MANLFYDKERDIIPNWHRFDTTTVLGELNSIDNKNESKKEKYSIDDYILDFENNKTLIYAADLISASISNNQTKNEYVKLAAEFILTNSRYSTHTQKMLANKILNPNSELKSVLDNNISKLNEFSSNKYYEKIKDLKTKLSIYPYNPILLVELSRYYSIIGKEDKSINLMKQAIHLDKNNRFVLRSAARLFTHYNTESNEHLKYIYKILNSSNLSKSDTWVMATEIAIANKLEKSSKYIKKGLMLIDSKNYSPFDITELCSSIATVELKNGNHKNSRKLFNQSMNKPNANSLAQTIWASTKDHLIKTENINKYVSSGYEAIARSAYQKENFNDTYDSIVQWFIDQPFSTHPAIFGSFVASTLTKNYENAIEISNAGLISNPYDSRLLNNAAYAYALSGNIEKAHEYILKIKTNQLNEDSKICVKATKGLIAFRSNKIDIGRELYKEAILDSKKDNNYILNWTAILNWTREEILFGSIEEAEYLMVNVVSSIPNIQSEIVIKTLKKDVLDLYEKKLNEKKSSSINTFIDNLKKSSIF